MDLPPPIPVTAPAMPLPLRFNRPDEWPEPSVDWLAANQGWDPPAGWTPAPGVAPTGPGWVWWSRDEVGWTAMTGTVTGRLRIGVVSSAAVFVVALALTLVPATRHLDFSFVFWGALIFGLVNLARHAGGLRRTPVEFSSFVRSRAAEVRQTLDATTYGEHRARFGPGALPLDQFLARRSKESWSFTGRWPADQNHLGVTDQFRLPETPAHARGRRAVTAVLAGVAGVALVVIAVNAFGAGQLGSGAGSAALGTTASTGGSTATVTGSTSELGPAPSPAAHSGVKVAALVLNPQTPSGATCTGPGDCFVIRVDTAPACAKATLVVEFYSSSSARVADRHQTLTLPLTGATYTDVAIDEPTPTDVYAGVADSYCAGS